MKPAPFAYHRTHSVGEAVALLTELGDEAKILAGGLSLVPMMNFRLARPSALKGSYREALDLAEKQVRDKGWLSERDRLRDNGQLAGTGYSCFSERTAYGAPTMSQRRMGMTPGFDTALVRMDPTGEVIVTTGTCGHGQGHETTFAQIVADRLGVHPDQVRLRQGDTDLDRGRDREQVWRGPRVLRRHLGRPGHRDRTGADRGGRARGRPGDRPRHHRRHGRPAVRRRVLGLPVHRGGRQRGAPGPDRGPGAGRPARRPDSGV